MKKFIIHIIILSVPLLLMLVFTNYYSDAARLFDSGYEKNMARIISNGHNATNVENYDERIFQKELIGQSITDPNAVVIGSSRTMLITSNLVCDTTMSNNSVSGASIKDLISIYQIYKDHDKLPEKIIVGIDPWYFNHNRKDERWKSIEEYYYKFCKKNFKEDNFNSKYKELLSLSYFQSSLRALPKIIMNQNEAVATDSKRNYSATKLKDGSLVYASRFRNASQMEVDKNIDLYNSKEIYGLKNFDYLSKKRWSEFTLMLDDMKLNNIEVEFFLAPYSPKTFQKIKKNYPLVVDLEARIIDYAKNNVIKVYGSYDPTKLALNKTYFYDGMHAKETAIESIMKNDDNY